jgi:hypothetical protein
VRPNIDAHDIGALEIKGRPQITLDPHGVNGSFIKGGKSMYLVGSQPHIEWVVLENAKCLDRCFSLSRG